MTSESVRKFCHCQAVLQGVLFMGLQVIHKNIYIYIYRYIYIFFFFFWFVTLLPSHRAFPASPTDPRPSTFGESNLVRFSVVSGHFRPFSANFGHKRAKSTRNRLLQGVVAQCVWPCGGGGLWLRVRSQKKKKKIYIYIYIYIFIFFFLFIDIS